MRGRSGFRCWVGLTERESLYMRDITNGCEESVSWSVALAGMYIERVRMGNGLLRKTNRKLLHAVNTYSSNPTK